jgi:hypothetical protein
MVAGMVEYDPLYVAARGVLLDALEALGSQRDAIIVVGAQAVYIQTGDAGLSVAPYTLDADLALAPDQLADDPLLEEMLEAAGFSQEGQQPGSWVKTVPVDGREVAIPVDLMVPEGAAPPGGRRGVRLPPHDKRAARKAPGLEGTLIDHSLQEIAALGGNDSRRFLVRVAGPASLLVAKLHKLEDRNKEGRLDRIADKDAADIYRIIQTVATDVLADRLKQLLADSIARPVTEQALEYLHRLFGVRSGVGIQMASDSLRTAIPADRVASIATSVVAGLEAALGASP